MPTLRSNYLDKQHRQLTDEYITRSRQLEITHKRQHLPTTNVKLGNRSMLHGFWPEYARQAGDRSDSMGYSLGLRGRRLSPLTLPHVPFMSYAFLVFFSRVHGPRPSTRGRRKGSTQPYWLTSMQIFCRLDRQAQQRDMRNDVKRLRLPENDTYTIHRRRKLNPARKTECNVY